MDPITTALIAAASALLQSAMDVTIQGQVDKQALKREIQDAQQAAIEQTIRSSGNTETASLIITSLSESIKPETGQAFADELGKILLLSDQPDVAGLSGICEQHFRYRKTLNQESPLIERSEIEEVLSSLVENLRLKLLDQPIHRSLYTRSESLRIDRQILTLDEERRESQRQQLDVQTQIRDALFGKSARRDFYAHVNHPPANYVRREALLADLVSRVISSKAEPTVLHGMGGIGKSVIARAICEEARVQEFFSGGILLLELGKSPNIIQTLIDLIQRLGGIVDPNSIGIPILKNKLWEHVKDRNVLLIVDNAWSYSDVEIFNVTNTNSRLFITTRQRTIADKLGVAPVPCPEMTYTEGLQLLTEWSGRQQRKDSEETKRKILEKLGFHPLAIKLAAAQLAYHPSQTGEEWLSIFSVRSLEVQPVESPADSLKLTFELSLEALSETQSRLYGKLAIFPEDAHIPASTVKGLWKSACNVSETEAQNTLIELSSMALITTTEATSSQTIRVHPLLHDFLQEGLSNTELQRTHADLLAYYRKGGDWTAVRPDGYFHEHLAFHLVEAGMNSELYALLIDSPAWWEAKIAYSGHVANYVTDIQIALSTFSEPVSVEDLLILVQLYAASEAVHQASARYSDEELQVMVWLGQETQALQRAWLHADPKNRFDAILALQRTFREQGKPTLESRELIAIASDITVVEFRVLAYIALAEFFVEEPKNNEVNALFDTALRTVKGEPTSWQKLQDTLLITRSLVRLGMVDSAKNIIRDILVNQDEVLKETPDLVAQVVELAAALEFSSHVTKPLFRHLVSSSSKFSEETLASISPRLYKGGYSSEAEAIVDQIQDTYWRIVALGDLAIGCHELGHEEKADGYFALAFHELEELRQLDPFHGEAAAYMLVADLAKSGRFFEATNLTHGIMYLHWRGLALSSLIRNLAQVGLIAEARKRYEERGNVAIEKDAKIQLCLEAVRRGYKDLAADLLRKPDETPLYGLDHDLANNTIRLVNVLVEQNRLDRAVKLAERIPIPGRKMQTLARTAVAYLSLGNQEQARQLCDSADRIALPDNDFKNVENLAWLMLSWFSVEENARAKKVFKRAMDLAVDLSPEHGRCAALTSVIKLAYLTRTFETGVWNEVLPFVSQEIVCKNAILESLATVVDLDDDLSFAQQLVAQISSDDCQGAWVLETLAERAIETRNDDYLNSVLVKLEQCSHLEGNCKDMYSESLARTYTRLGDYKQALVISESIPYIESRVSIQGQVAASMLDNGQEDEARRVFEKAAFLASSIPTYSGQWRYALARWSANLFRHGYHLEALRIYRPDPIWGYSEIVDDWKMELGNLSKNLEGELLLKIAKIFVWVDPQWEMAIRYFEETA